MSSLIAPTAVPTLPQRGSQQTADDLWIESFLLPRLEAAAGRPNHVWIALPAPVGPVERLLEVSNRDHGAVWDPPHDTSFSGVGVAWKAQLKGANRFHDLRKEAGQVLRNLHVESHSNALAFEPRVVGGFAFEVGAADEDPWRDFGDGCFTLPRFVYGSDGVSAMLAVVVRGDEISSPAQRASLIAEARQIWAGLDRLPTQELGGILNVDPRPEVHDTPEDGADWIRRIEDIREAIRRGEVEKIVAARRAEVPLSSELAVAKVLGLLGHGLRASTRFAFCRDSTVFLGVTPERLLAKEGLKIHTEALAGSIERGHGAELLDSGKDRLEQQLVVDSIVRRLEPLCDRLQVAARPTVRELRDVVHLHTPIHGRLKSPRHILELVEELHPTPAVGGVPTPSAVAWISERETHARGWYAAPIGWFDAEGDGELAVALRSCVLAKDKAYLFVGAGIVADSDPELELRETELKKQAMLSALRG